MKKINYTIIAGVIAILLIAAGCSNDILEEKPRSIYEPGFFKTEQGIQYGLTSLYAHTRYFLGQYYYAAAQNGTDEYTYAQSADNNFKDTDMSGVGSLNPSSSRSDALWNAVYSNINTASGIIENASEVGLSEELISEARFWRAYDYFLLVQTFGGIPLDLGAGELKFNTSPSRVSVRNTVPEVYTRAVFPDLKISIDNLPETGRVTGGVTKTAARLFLAKAYLTYAWWLENPNNIPTYPEVARTDPDGHDAAWYFQEAYNIALQGINNPGSFGLLDYFYDVHLGSNDRNKEIVLYSDHIEDEYYNQASLSWSNGGAPENFAVWFVTSNYGNIRSSADGTTYGISSVQRDAAQWGGRPWTRMAPTIEAYTETFDDKSNDSRFDGTFATVYYGNWAKAGISNEFLYNANGLPVRNGEPVLTFLDEEPGVAVTYPAGAGPSNVGAGTLPGRADWVIAPSGISRIYYPGLWKLGTYRTDSGTGLGQPNGAITRPWNIAKFSEFYLIAAEAAVKGASGSMTARQLVNVLRARAGMWRWKNNGNYEKIEDNSTAMVAATPAVIDIDYILEERSREYFGEGYRWYDLVRTQKWAELAGSYTICGDAAGDHTPVTYTRDIQPFHYLRPIPQSQIDGMTMSDEEKKAYQNPGY
ncbi:RagB/SusD family nutrient uptake outer membrane protein [Proteiniphilum acetatigenes]|uniref:RagB/SusD family nutrient uptake outer membrane protein n=1 Tax=Proteiniphilum acetatigenes TaxID=294710 RepID=UPI0004767470|nr:RagB/SusD family nutrient uptake outer membrane protein [Proteiniphilum acetatigenes]SFL58001.1 Starch-binding associating with outer membrane [Porphyromonadaceae bacterium KH3CP3RA]